MAPTAPDFTLYRTQQDDYATFGTLRRADNTVLAVTLEPPFRDANHDGVRDVLGRIAHGTYELFLRTSHRHGGTGKRDYDVWEFLEVPDAIAVQIHIGNFPWHSEGCILLGTQRKLLTYLGPTVRTPPYPRTQGAKYLGVANSHTAHGHWMREASARADARGRIRVQIVDDFAAPPGSWA